MFRVTTLQSDSSDIIYRKYVSRPRKFVGKDYGFYDEWWPGVISAQCMEIRVWE
jgi:hypothetical protein